MLVPVHASGLVLLFIASVSAVPLSAGLARRTTADDTAAAVAGSISAIGADYSVFGANARYIAATQRLVDDTIALSQGTVDAAVARAAEKAYNDISESNDDHHPTPSAVDAYNAALTTAQDANYLESYTACVASVAQRNTAIFAAAAALPGANSSFPPLLAAYLISIADIAAAPLDNRMGGDPGCNAVALPYLTTNSPQDLQSIVLHLQSLLDASTINFVKMGKILADTIARTQQPGVVQVVFKSEPDVIRYFAQQLNTFDGGFTLTTDINSAAKLKIPYGLCQNSSVTTTGFTLPFETAFDDAYPYFAPASAVRSSNLAMPGAGDAGQFAPAALNDPGKANGKSSASGDGYAVWSAEADTWSIDCSTRDLTLRWDDPNGGRILASAVKFWARSTDNVQLYFSQLSSLQDNGGLEMILSLVEIDE